MESDEDVERCGFARQRDDSRVPDAIKLTVHFQTARALGRVSNELPSVEKLRQAIQADEIRRVRGLNLPHDRPRHPEGVISAVEYVVERRGQMLAS